MLQMKVCVNVIKGYCVYARYDKMSVYFAWELDREERNVFGRIAWTACCT